MNDIDKMPSKCRDCPYWERAAEPYVCHDCTTPVKKCGGDYILRSDVLEIAMEWCPDDDGSVGKVGDLREMLDELESIPAADVEPKRKTGVWTEENMCFDAYVWRCSVCKEDWDIIGGTPLENDMRFCPKCGAEMIAEVPKGEEDAEVH